MSSRSRSRWNKLLLVFSGILLTLLLAAVFTLGSLNPPFEADAWHDLVILYALSTFIVAALLVFAFILIRTLIRLVAERRAELLGSRFKTKMVIGAMAISLSPLVFLFFISYALMNRTLNRWFPRSLEIASQQSQALLNEETHAESLRLQALLERVRAQLSAQEQSDPQAAIVVAARLAASQGAEGIWIVDSHDRLLPSADPLISPLILDPSLSFVRSLPSGGELWNSRSGSFLAVRGALGPNFLIVAHRLPRDFIERTATVQTQTALYESETQQIRLFKRQILLTLSLFTLLLLFGATWFALYLAKQVTIPIQALAEATQEVATGHFETLVKVHAEGELGSLVRSFNKMTAQLADSRRQIDEFTRSLQMAVQELDRRRTLIETVLENIPTGVISLDPEGAIVRMNSAAREIFGTETEESVTLAGLGGDAAARDFQHLIRRALRMGAASQELEFRLKGRVLHAAVTVSSLGPRRSRAGYVVVVDDLTELLRAQKASAWQEVAQRIAHEIKNPLTPIQLSADRLSRYLQRHEGQPAQDAELTHLVGECAALIGREVGTLEALVNAFSQFVRFPVARLAPTDPNEVVKAALQVFQGRLDDVLIHTELAADLPPVIADAELLRRVLVNLIDNAAEAMEGATIKSLRLSTSFRAAHDTVEISVSDSGYGISPEDKDKLFLPHFSTKERGTGLGLAIASRVVAEHHGLIRAEDNTPVGARFVIELPAAEPVVIPAVPET